MQTTPHHQEQDLSGLTPEEVALQAVQEHAGQKGNLLPILHTIQDRIACIPESVVPVLAEHGGQGFGTFKPALGELLDTLRDGRAAS